MSAKEVATTKNQRTEDIVTILLALCMESHTTYLQKFTVMAGVLADNQPSKSTMQNWLRPYVDNAKELLIKANANGDAVTTPVKTPVKAKPSPAKAKQTPAKQTPAKRKPTADVNGDVDEAIGSKSVKGRKDTPRPKKIKTEEPVEEDCDITEENAVTEVLEGLHDAAGVKVE